MADKELYRACAVEVKRQIWQDNQALFGDEVSPLLKQYILEKEGALFSTELSVLHNFFSPSPKARRQGEVRLGREQVARRRGHLASPFPTLTWVVLLLEQQACAMAGKGLATLCPGVGLLDFTSSVLCHLASFSVKLSASSLSSGKFLLYLRLTR